MAQRAELGVGLRPHGDRRAASRVAGHRHWQIDKGTRGVARLNAETRHPTPPHSPSEHQQRRRRVSFSLLVPVGHHASPHGGRWNGTLSIDGPIRNLLPVAGRAKILSQNALLTRIRQRHANDTFLRAPESAISFLFLWFQCVDGSGRPEL